MSVSRRSPCGLRQKLFPEKWYPGHYEKLGQTDVFTGGGHTTLNSSKLDTVFTELEATPALRGIQFSTHWGWIENAAGGPSAWDWSAIDNLVQRLHALRLAGYKKYLILSIDMETDTVGLDANELLPHDMRATGGYTPLVPGYTAYQYAWPWARAAYNAVTNPEPDGWYAKLWLPYVQERFATFMEALANHVVPNTDGKTLDKGDYLIMVMTLESATTDPWDTYQGGTLSTYEDGLVDLITTMKSKFRRTQISMGLNYTRAFCASTIPGLDELKVGINTPNGNQSAGLITPTGNKGILKYYEDPAIATSLTLMVGQQGDDYKATTGIDARSDKVNLYDFPSYQTLYERARDTLNAHYIVWQRVTPFWLGGTYSESINGVTPDPYIWGNSDPVLSVLNFLQTHPDIIADEYGGLSSTRPTNWI